MAKAIPELDLIAPRDPAVESDTDEWPELTLTNAYVHLPDDHAELVSLLKATNGHPVTVVGQLEPLDSEDAQLYLNGPPKGRAKVTVILEDVRMFSYGQFTDGQTAIWAAGKAGWYTIKPAKRYQSTHAEMCEAIEVLYFITDAYREVRKRGKGKKAEILPDYTTKELFEKYAKEELGEHDAKKGEEAIYKHKEFIISSMVAGKEGLVWSNYPLYKTMVKKFPEVVAQAKKMQQALPIPKVEKTEKPKAKSKAQHVRKNSVDTASTTSSLKRKRCRAARGGAIEVISLDGASNTSCAVTAAEYPEDAMETVKDLPPSWTKPASSRRTRNASVPEPQPNPVATPAKDDDSDEELRARNKKNKSSLRPRASKASKSAGRKGGKGPPPEDDDDDGVDDSMKLPSSPTGSKRKHPEDEEPIETTRRSFKRRNSRPHDDEGIDIPTSPEAASSPASSTDILAYIATDLPIRSAYAPDPVHEDTWVCALNGCTHKIYGVSHPDSQRLIKEHYALHAYDDDARVQMVKKLQAPSLPVSHLMEKVKMTAKNQGFPDSLGGEMPDQVRSRFPPLPGTVMLRY